MKTENEIFPEKQEKEEKQEKIILPDELQKRILKFFLKTSIPRKIKLEKEKEDIYKKQAPKKENDSE